MNSGPCLLAAAVVPLLVVTKVITLPNSLAFLGYPLQVIDGFSWYKGSVLGVLGGVALLAVIRNWKTSPLDWPLMLLAGFAVASSLLSPFRALSWLGVPYIFEGVGTTLAYLVLVAAAARLSSQAKTDYLPISLAASLFVAAAICWAEQGGHCIYQSRWYASLFLNIPGAGSANYERGQLGAIGPFGNPNYTGMYAAMVWPFFLSLSLVDSRRWRYYLHLVASGIALALLCSTGTRGAVIAALFAAAIAVACAWHVGFRPRWSHAFLLILSHGAAIGLHTLIVNGQFVAERLGSIKGQFTVGAFTSPQPLESMQIRREGGRPAVRLDNGRLRFSWDGPDLLLERQLTSIRFMDAGFRPLPVRMVGNHVVLDDERFRKLTLNWVAHEPLQILDVNGLQIAVTDRGFRVLRAGGFVRPTNGERFPLPLSDTAFSNRGFIWSRTLPLLRSTVLLGRGPGAFPFEFPNNDVAAMANLSWGNSLVDKPHSFYLGYAYTFGFLALAVLVLLFTAYCVKVASALRCGNRQQVGMLLPFFAAFLGFALAAISIDSSIGVAAPFWVIFGAGLGTCWPPRRLATPRLLPLKKKRLLLATLLNQSEDTP